MECKHEVFVVGGNFGGSLIKQLHCTKCGHFGGGAPRSSAVGWLLSMNDVKKLNKIEENRDKEWREKNEC